MLLSHRFSSRLGERQQLTVPPNPPPPPRSLCSCIATLQPTTYVNTKDFSSDFKLFLFQCNSNTLFLFDAASVSLGGTSRGLYIIHPFKNAEARLLWRVFSNWSPDATDTRHSKSPQTSQEHNSICFTSCICWKQ